MVLDDADYLGALFMLYKYVFALYVPAFTLSYSLKSGAEQISVAISLNKEALLSIYNLYLISKIVVV